MKFWLPWIFVIFILVFPFCLAMAAGFLWLWDQQLLYQWLGLAAIMGFQGWVLMKMLQRRKMGPIKKATQPSEMWTAEGKGAWAKVEKIAEGIRLEDIDLENKENWWVLLKEVMETVANHFHAKSDNAVWEMPVPYLLKVIELAAQDLRQLAVKTIPGSHIWTINDYLRGQRLAAFGQNLYDVYRVASVAVNPTGALLRELKGLATDKVVEASSGEIKRWLLQEYVRKIGFYSIELYSGTVVLEEEVFEQHTTKASSKAHEVSQKRDTQLNEEPLRILVLGQVKAGKSSLINALFGEMKALVDVVPQTSKVEPYLLEIDGLERAIILDTAGYEDTDNPEQPLKEAKEEVERSDLIIMVCSSKTAARQSDRRLLDALRKFFQEVNREFPPLLIALSHIDHLRPFREWDPPYNVAEPTGLKEKNIRNAMEVVAQDLDLDLNQVVPVNLKLDRLYNLEDGLVPAILNHFDDSKRFKYLRCLKDFQDEEYWERLWEQAQVSGKLIVKTGFRLANQASKKLDKVSKQWLE